MAITIDRSRQVLDLSFPVVGELVANNTSDVIVPIHEESISIAADLDRLIRRLYPHTSFEFYIGGNKIPTEPIEFTFEPNNLYVVRYYFQKMPFEHLDPSAFLEFHDRVWIKYPQSDGNNAIVSGRSPTFPDNTGSKFSKEIKSLELPILPEKKSVVLCFNYESTLGLEITLPFADLPSKGKIRSVEIYPISKFSDVVLDERFFRFYADPVHWNNLSNTLVNAFENMTGKNPYSAIKAGKYTDKIVEDAKKSEKDVVKILESIFRYGTGCIKGLDCPPEYTGIYLHRIVGSIRGLCKSGSLTDDKLKYLQNLSAACRQYGLNTNPQQLSGIKRNVVIGY